MNIEDFIINSGDKILITGANGFIGNRVVKTLLDYGFRNLRCFVRPSGNIMALANIVESHQGAGTEVLKGNLLVREDCERAAKGVSIVFHLAAGVEKTFAGCFMNSAVTTRNLLDAVLKEGRLKRFLNVSSFAVYSPTKLNRGQILDETCETEENPHLRGDAYCFGKAKQDELVIAYNREYNLPYTIVRPGSVYGPGKSSITGRVGIDTFGIFLHMGGSNQIPFTYVDNCAEAIVRAGLAKKAEGKVFNIVDDDLPKSREFLRMYKKKARSFRSVGVHPRISYLLCIMWEKYSKWSNGQLPPAFNRKRWAAEWKGHRYSNLKLKEFTGWHPKVSTQDGLARFFKYIKELR